MRRGKTGSSGVAALLTAAALLALPAGALADDDDDDGGGGGGGAPVGGITFSVQDNGPLGDRISGATEPAVPPVAGTPRCGALEPEFAVTGEITVASTPAGDNASGAGNVPAFGAGVGAPFTFSASSGPDGVPAGGTFAVGFPTGRASAGIITCLDVVGNVAYMAGLRLTPGGGGGDDDDGDDGDGDDGDDGDGGDD